MKKYHPLFHLFLLIIFTVLGICFGFIDTAIGNIYKSSINAQWSEDKSHFWYRNDLAKGHREFVLVDMTKGMRRLAFDHKKMAASLSNIGKVQLEAGKLPLEGLSFDLEKSTVSFRALGRSFLCDLKTHELTKIKQPKKLPKEIKSQVAKKVKKTKSSLKKFYNDPMGSVDKQKLQKWAAIQVVKVFFGIPVIPGR